jgi:hypothetical protein
VKYVAVLQFRTTGTQISVDAGTNTLQSKPSRNAEGSATPNTAYRSCCAIELNKVGPAEAKRRYRILLETPRPTNAVAKCASTNNPPGRDETKHDGKNTQRCPSMLLPQQMRRNIIRLVGAKQKYLGNAPPSLKDGWA